MPECDSGDSCRDLTQIMFDAMPICGNCWSEDYQILACNEETMRLFKLSSKQEYVDSFYDLSPEYQPNGELSFELVQQYVQKAFQEGYVRFEWLHQNRCGELIPVEITLVRAPYGDKYVVAGYTRDLRELKAMLNDMRKVENDLRLARDAAEESAKVKNKFLANMSHEIRTPMNGILGLLHLALNTELTVKQRDYLEKTRQSAKELLMIIDDILDFSKIEAGKLDIERVEFAFQDVFDDITDMFAAKCEKMGLSFSLAVPTNLPKTVIGDPLRLKQVLVNLVSNALKFTKTGGIQVAVQKIKQERLHMKFQFSVADTGFGMTPEQLSGLFDPFTQADTSTTRKFGGAGLGLAISKNLVKMMDGDIWAESQFGQGSTFYFTTRFAFNTEKPLNGRHA